jgi:hypothetical protein
MSFWRKVARHLKKEHEKPSSKLEQKVLKLEKKLAQKNEVLSELMEEHIALKKTPGED